MTISEAIQQLQYLATKHGDVEVYFDCPSCGKSWTPNAAVAVAVHLTENRPPSVLNGSEISKRSQW